MQNQQQQQQTQQIRSRYFAFDFFTYEVDFNALANGNSDTQNFVVDNDSDFLLTKLTMFADIAGAAQTDSSRIIPLATIVINDTGSGRNLMDSAVPLPSIFGSGALPFILPRQRVIASRSVVNVTLSNFSAATTYNIRLSFVGEKAFIS